jgi:hypothetical protein
VGDVTLEYEDGAAHVVSNILISQVLASLTGLGEYRVGLVPQVELVASYVPTLNEIVPGESPHLFIIDSQHL